MSTLISPSLLSANFLDLRKDLEMIDQSEADWLHLDVMDGVFVPNISFGFPVIDAVAKVCRKPLDVHLMIVSPEKYIERFAKAGADMISFHLNATENPSMVLSQIRSLGLKAGLAINPDIEVESLFPYLEQVDYILLMSVFAGFGGQKFIETTYERVRTLKNELDSRGINIPIEVDGGVSPTNASALRQSGVEILVAGSAVFKSSNPAATIASMKA